MMLTTIVLIIMVLAFFFLILGEEEGIGCLTIILCIVLLITLGIGYSKSTYEVHRTRKKVTTLVALSDGVGASGTFFIGIGSIGSEPVYFYSYQTSQGITQDTIKKSAYCPVYIKEVDSRNAKKVVTWKESRRLKKTGRLWRFIYWLSAPPGEDSPWVHSGSIKETTVFEVPRGSVTSGFVIDTK